MNIQSMYSDIDLDANGMETEFQAAFEQLLWFINQDFSNRGKGDFDGEDIQITFDRDILINESEAIDNCSKSVGILSDETIVEQHPWTNDVELELARLKKEKEEAMEQAQEYSGAFGAGNKQNEAWVGMNNSIPTIPAIFTERGTAHEKCGVLAGPLFHSGRKRPQTK